MRRDLGLIAVLVVLFVLGLRWSLIQLSAPDPLIQMTGWQITVWVLIAIVVMLG